MGKIPRFKSEKEAREFWDSHNLTDYLEELEEVRAKVFIKPKKQVVSIRLERSHIEALRTIARRMGLGVTTLNRMWVLERLEGK